MSRLRALSCTAAIAAFACALIPASAGAAFSLLGHWGGEGSGNGLFTGQIGGVATAANGDVYVVDTGSTLGGSLIEEFGSKGEFIREWGKKGSGAGEMFEPESIAAAGGGPEVGDIYVADSRNRRVDEFTSEGKFIRAWGWAVIKETPTKHEFQICTTITVCQEGEPHGEDGGGFETPTGVAVDPSSGDVYVSDPMTNDFALPIQKFSPNGNFIGTVGLSEGLHGPGAAGTFNEPTALSTDSSGDLYVVEVGNERVQELSKEGKFIRLWGRGVHKGESGPSEKFGVCKEECQIGGEGQAAGDFNFINGSGEFNIAVDSSGNVWVPDSGNIRVQEFTSTGEFEMGFGWGVSNGEEKFELCTSTCQVGLKGAAPPQFERPIGVAAAPSGCPIYVTDGDANELVDEFGTCGVEKENEQPKEEQPQEQKEQPKEEIKSNQPPNVSTAAGAGSSSGNSSSSGNNNNQPPSTPTPAELETKLATAFGLPSAKLCYSKRSFKIHIQQPPGYPRVVSAEVFLGTKRERSLNKKGLTDEVVLKQLPYGTFTIRIVARTVNGTTLTGTRTYHTCRPKPIHPHGHPRL